MKKKIEPNQDFIKDCNSFGVSPNEFKDIFCKRCRNPECVHAEWVTSLWSSRMDSQVEVLLNNPTILHEIPSQYADLKTHSFEEIGEAAAYRIEESWDDPAEYQDGIEKPSSSRVNQVVDDAVLSLARARGKNVKLSEEIKIEKFNKQTEDLMESEIVVSKEEIVETPSPQVKAEVPPQPQTSEAPAAKKSNISLNKANTDVPAEGIMLGGASAPATSVEDFDPWAVDEGDEVINVGATIKMNSGKKNGKD